MDVEVLSVLGILFVVQSSIQPSSYLSEKTHEFLDRMRKEIHELSDAEFDAYKESVLSKLKEKDYNIVQESGRYWGEIAKHTFLFQRSKH